MLLVEVVLGLPLLAPRLQRSSWVRVVATCCCSSALQAERCVSLQLECTLSLVRAG